MFLEGLEIVFIVITFGLNADDVPTAVAGAAVAGVLVLARRRRRRTGRSPRVPQNTIKFAVGLLLSTFGTFWAVEGLGVFAPGGESLEWPGGDAALLVLLAAWCAFAWGAVRGCWRARRARRRRRECASSRGFGRFWYDFVVGDDWRIALGVVLVLAAGAVLVATGALADELLAPLVGRGDRRGRLGQPRGRRAALAAGLAPRQLRRRGERRAVLALGLEHAPLEVLELARAALDRRGGPLAGGRAEHVARVDAREPGAQLLEVGLDLLGLAGGQVAAEDLELDLALELRLALLDDLLVLLSARSAFQSASSRASPSTTKRYELPPSAATRASTASRRSSKPRPAGSATTACWSGSAPEPAQVAPDGDAGARRLRRQPVDEQVPAGHAAEPTRRRARPRGSARPRARG